MDHAAEHPRRDHYQSTYTRVLGANPRTYTYQGVFRYSYTWSVGIVISNKAIHYFIFMHGLLLCGVS